MPFSGGSAQYVELEESDLPLSGNIMVRGEAVIRGMHVGESGSHGALVSRGGTQRHERPSLPPFVELDEVPIENPVDSIQAQMVRSSKAGAPATRRSSTRPCRPATV